MTLNNYGGSEVRQLPGLWISEHYDIQSSITYRVTSRELPRKSDEQIKHETVTTAP